MHNGQSKTILGSLFGDSCLFIDQIVTCHATYIHTLLISTKSSLYARKVNDCFQQLFSSCSFNDFVSLRSRIELFMSVPFVWLPTMTEERSSFFVLLIHPCDCLICMGNWNARVLCVGHWSNTMTVTDGLSTWNYFALLLLFSVDDVFMSGSMKATRCVA